MAEIRVNPTRMELKKLKTRLATARRGHKLLKDKRDELMKQFLTTVREAKTLREEVEKELAGISAAFSVASAVISPQIMTSALMLPKREATLAVAEKNVMSVQVPEFSFELKGAENDSMNFGLAFTSGEIDTAVEKIGALLPRLILLAQIEKTAFLLANEIEKTRRRVNALEYIMIPQFEKTIKEIKMKLDENERGNTTRLMKVKDMMIKEQMEKSSAY